MKKISAILIVSLLGVSSICIAADEVTDIRVIKDQEQIVLASSASIPVRFGSDLAAANAVEHTDAASVPATGIVFAAMLFGAGLLVRRKKKLKTNDMVGAFARIS